MTGILVSYVVWILVGLYLVASLPYIGHLRTYSGFRSNPPRFAWVEREGRETIANALDLESGIISQGTLHALAWFRYPKSRGEWYLADNSTGMIEVFEGESSTPSRRIATGFTGNFFDPPLMGRYLLGRNNSGIVAVDLDSDSTTPVMFTDNAWWWSVSTDIRPLENSPFVIVEVGGSPSTLQVFEWVNDRFRQKTAWPVCTGGSGLQIWDGHIYSIDVSGNILECRDAESLRMVSSQAIPGALVGSMNKMWGLGRWIYFENPANGKKEIRSIDDLEQFRTVETDDLFPQAGDGLDSSLQLFHSTSAPHQLVVVESATKRIVSDIKPSQAVETASLIKVERAAWADSRYGLTVTIVSLSTGKIEKTIQPFRWNLVLTLVWIVSGMALGFIWFAGRTRELLDRRLQVVLLCLPLIALVVVRLHVSGNALHFQRFASQYLIGMLWGLSITAVVSAVWSRERQVFHLSPLLLVVTILCILLALFQNGTPSHADPSNEYAICCIFVGSLICGAVAGGVRCLAWLVTRRWRANKEHSRAHTSMTDLFVFTFLVALILTAVRWLPRWPAMAFDFKTGIVCGVVAAVSFVILLPMSTAAASTRTSVRNAQVVFGDACLVLLAADYLWSFVCGDATGVLRYSWTLIATRTLVSAIVSVTMLQSTMFIAEQPKSPCALAEVC
ncbi:MAG: hypothetical protein U0892_10495 [Pirellulales bacterium]